MAGHEDRMATGVANREQWWLTWASRSVHDQVLVPYAAPTDRRITSGCAVRLCDQTLPHVATIAVVKWLCQRRDSARIDVTCSTQSRTGRRTPQFGRFRGNSAGVCERVRTARRLSGWTYLTLLNRFRPLCGENFGNDVAGCAQDSDFPHRRPRETRAAIFCRCGILLEVLAPFRRLLRHNVRASSGSAR